MQSTCCIVGKKPLFQIITEKQSYYNGKLNLHFVFPFEEKYVFISQGEAWLGSEGGFVRLYDVSAPCPAAMPAVFTRQGLKPRCSPGFLWDASSNNRGVWDTLSSHTLEGGLGSSFKFQKERLGKKKNQLFIFRLPGKG